MGIEDKVCSVKTLEEQIKEKSRMIREAYEKAVRYGQAQYMYHGIWYDEAIGGSIVKTPKFKAGDVIISKKGRVCTIKHVWDRYYITVQLVKKASSEDLVVRERKSAIDRIDGYYVLESGLGGVLYGQ